LGLIVVNELVTNDLEDIQEPNAAIVSWTKIGYYSLWYDFCPKIRDNSNENACNLFFSHTFHVFLFICMSIALKLVNNPLAILGLALVAHCRAQE
jgi:hypothetical protein